MIGILLVSVVISLFVVHSLTNIRKGYGELKIVNNHFGIRVINVIRIIFSVVILTSTLLIALIVFFNFGR